MLHLLNKQNFVETFIVKNKTPYKSSVEFKPFSGKNKNSKNSVERVRTWASRMYSEAFTAKPRKQHWHTGFNRPI